MVEFGFVAGFVPCGAGAVGELVVISIFENPTIESSGDGLPWGCCCHHSASNLG